MRLDLLDQLLDGVRRHRRVHGKHHGRGDGERHRIEILAGVVGNLTVQGGIDDVVDAIDQHRVAVGCRLGGPARSNIAAGSADILDIELDPVCSDNPCAMRRAKTSVGPPGANGTITRTGRAG